MRKIIFFSAIITALFCGMLSANDAKEELFFSANQLYKDGKYEEALEKYLKLEKMGFASGHLYYNIGNTCFRLKTLGHAILYYERAAILLPRDEDLEYNLKYVRNLARDAIERDQDLLSIILFWPGSMTLSESALLFIIINIIFWSSMIVRLFTKEEWSFYFMISALVLWVISGASYAKKAYDIYYDDRAVILAEEVEVRSGPDSGDTVLFRLHEGAIVNFEREEGGWFLIGLPDNKRGWIEDRAAALLRTDR